MARVRSFSPSTQDIRPHPTEVDCEYRVVVDADRRLLHLTTFGSDDRASRAKSSQSLQVDVDAARELIVIIETAFPELRRS
ncbi:hypothetical protein ATM99_15165 [Cellulomonas sp. B6]|nr:hypothetical protein ATM99_15165 [Cellulomonas sp. B6]